MKKTFTAKATILGFGDDYKNVKIIWESSSTYAYKNLKESVESIIESAEFPIKDILITDVFFTLENRRRGNRFRMRGHRMGIQKFIDAFRRASGHYINSRGAFRDEMEILLRDAFREDN